MTVRIGHGVDAHRFVPNIPLRVGGVTVPHHAGLEGHSDGDVAAHAFCQAVLAASGMGDMGKHFPSTDPRWRSANSLLMVREAANLVDAAGLVIESGHVVIIAEAPRLAVHLAAMSVALNEAAQVDAGVITVSVTSTDGLGFAGRGEGMAASAVVLVGSVS